VSRAWSLASPPQFVLQQRTENMTASPPPTDIDHPSTTGGTEPPPAATVIKPAVCAPAAPRIPTAIRDAQRLSIAASWAAIQSRQLATAAQSIIRLYRRTRLRIEKRNALYPFPAAFYNKYGPFMLLSSCIDHQNSFGSTPNASATSSSTSATVRTNASAVHRRYHQTKMEISPAMQQIMEATFWMIRECMDVHLHGNGSAVGRRPLALTIQPYNLNYLYLYERKLFKYPGQWLNKPCMVRLDLTFPSFPLIGTILHVDQCFVGRVLALNMTIMKVMKITMHPETVCWLNTTPDSSAIWNNSYDSMPPISSARDQHSWMQCSLLLPPTYQYGWLHLAWAIFCIPKTKVKMDFGAGNHHGTAKQSSTQVLWSTGQIGICVGRTKCMRKLYSTCSLDSCRADHCIS